MNTEQKAQVWIASWRSSMYQITMSCEAEEIITALLAEREHIAKLEREQALAESQKNVAWRWDGSKWYEPVYESFDDDLEANSFGATPEQNNAINKALRIAQNQEAVAYISQSALNSLTTGAHASVRVWAKKDDEAVDDIALYTAPPSQDVQALIAEVDDWLNNGWDRVIQGNHDYPTLPEILDKYRGVK